jgi:hypothetical protein
VRSTHKYLTVLLALFAVVLAGCAGGPSEESLAFCDDYIDLSAALGAGPDEADPDAWVTSVTETLESMQAGSPSEISSAVNGVSDALLEPISQLDEEGFFAATGSEQYMADSQVISEYLTTECDIASVSVTAVDYAFEADLDGIEAGTTAFEFTNEGSEFHELALMRINDGVEMPIEELLALPQEEAEQNVTFMGVSFAAPGAESTMFTDLDEGNYVMICFIPTGSTSMEAAETAEGPPHFMNGMVSEFTVTG